MTVCFILLCFCCIFNYFCMKGYRNYGSCRLKEELGYKNTRCQARPCANLLSEVHLAKLIAEKKNETEIAAVFSEVETCVNTCLQRNHIGYSPKKARERQGAAHWRENNVQLNADKTINVGNLGEEMENMNHLAEYLLEKRKQGR